MNNSNNTSESGTMPSKVWRYLKKNGTTLLLYAFIAAMIFSPDVKALVIRGLMLTGIFNAKVEAPSPQAEASSALAFDFRDQNGVIGNTASLEGKVVFINFWASWCGPCRAEFPSIQALYDEYKEDPRIVFLLLNEDSEPSLGTEYLAKEYFTLPFYQTAGPVAPEVYDGKLPTTLVLNKEGQMVLHHTGFANYSATKFKAQLEQLMSE